MTKIVYIAGPMTGLPDFNRPAFHHAAEHLEAAGYTVLNPARAEGREACTTWQDYMRASVRDIANADGVALLPDWNKSRGAQIEHALAAGLGLDVRRLPLWLPGVRAWSA